MGLKEQDTWAGSLCIKTYQCKGFQNELVNVSRVHPLVCKSNQYKNTLSLACLVTYISI